MQLPCNVLVILVGEMYGKIIPAGIIHYLTILLDELHRAAGHIASHFVRKGHMTHISNLRHVTVQRSTALIFLHLPSSVPPFHAQAWRTAQATRTAFLLKHAQGRMSTCTVTRVRHSRCSGQFKPKFASTETADIWDPSKCFLKV